jgi:hypothetical protein
LEPAFALAFIISLFRRMALLAIADVLEEQCSQAIRPSGQSSRQENTMPLRILMAAAALALLALSGCASTGSANNTTYSQYQGYAPVPDFGASDPGGVRVGY